MGDGAQRQDLRQWSPLGSHTVHFHLACEWMLEGIGLKGTEGEGGGTSRWVR